MICPTPFETLTAYWLGELTDADALEEHLFACDRCAAANEKLGELVHALEGWIPPIISNARRDRLLAQGKKLVFNPVAPGESHARFDAGIDVLLHQLAVDLAKAERVDVEVTHGTGFHVTFENVPFDREAGVVLVACQRHFQALPGDPTFHVYAFEAGARRKAAEFTIVHEWM
jgi:hypothetical protein